MLFPTKSIVAAFDGMKCTTGMCPIVVSPISVLQVVGISKDLVLIQTDTHAVYYYSVLFLSETAAQQKVFTLLEKPNQFSQK